MKISFINYDQVANIMAALPHSKEEVVSSRLKRENWLLDSAVCKIMYQLHPGSLALITIIDNLNMKILSIDG